MDDDVLTQLRAAQTWRQAGNPTRALEFARRAATLAPGESIVDIELARIYLELDQTELALAASKRAVSLSPGAHVAQLILAESYASAAADVAGRRARTRFAIKKREAQRLELLELAEVAATAALAAAPTSARALHWLMRIRVRSGNLHGAAEAAAKIGAFDIAVADAAALELAQARRDFDTVERLARRRLTDDPTDAYAHAMLADAAAATRRPADESTHLVAAARGGNSWAAERLVPRATELAKAPATVHVVVGTIVAFAGGLVVTEIATGAELVASIAALVWGTGWIWARRRQRQILAPLAFAGRRAVRRRMLRRAVIAWALVAVVGVLICANTLPVNRDHAIEYLRMEVCKEATTRCEPVFADGSPADGSSSSAVATTISTPTSATVPRAPASDLERRLLAPFGPPVRPVITEAKIRSTVAWQYYLVILAIGAIGAATVAVAAATINLRWRV